MDYCSQAVVYWLCSTLTHKTVKALNKCLLSFLPSRHLQSSTPVNMVRVLLVLSWRYIQSIMGAKRKVSSSLLETQGKGKGFIEAIEIEFWRWADVCQVEGGWLKWEDKLGWAVSMTIWLRWTVDGYLRQDITEISLTSCHLHPSMKTGISWVWKSVLSK